MPGINGGCAYMSGISGDHIYISGINGGCTCMLEINVDQVYI